MRSIAVAALVLALPLAAIMACGSEETIETEQGTVTVDRDDDTTTFSMDGGDKLQVKAGENIALPEDFPKDVPVYPDATLVTSMATPEGVMISSRSSADPGDVLAFYKKELASEGWKLEAEMNMGPQRMLTFSKGDRQATVTLSSDEGETQISLMTGR